MSAKTKRTRVDIVPHLGGLWWVVVLPIERIKCLHRTDAIEVGVMACRLMECKGKTSQLVIRTRRGTVAEERTYPRSSDPERRRG